MSGDFQEVQKVCLELLEKVKEICKKYDIKYFADSGTLLGAVRNNKFIPWDNDMDLVMLREDYEKFLKVAEEELKAPYYLQTGYKDEGYHTGLSKIRKSNTTAILKSQLNTRKFNQGIFIDIFPLDSTIENKILNRIQLENIFLLRKVFNLKDFKSMKIKSGSIIKKIIIVIAYPFLLMSQKYLYKKMDNIAQWGNSKKSKYVDKVMYRGYHHAKCSKKIPKSCYSESMEVPFEDTTIVIPKNSDLILTALYGDDYMTPKQIPDDHGEVIFDTKNSYLKYLNHEIEIKE